MHIHSPAFNNLIYIHILFIFQLISITEQFQIVVHCHSIFQFSLVIRWQYGLLSPANSSFNSTWFKRLLEDQTEQLLYYKQARIFCHGKFIGYFCFSFFIGQARGKRRVFHSTWQKQLAAFQTPPVCAESTDGQTLPLCQFTALRTSGC